MEISIITPPGQRGSFTIGARETARSLKGRPPSHLQLLDDPVIASLACVNRSGTIHISPVWVLAYGGPRQGAVIREMRPPFRSDWEHVLGAVIDFAVT